MLPGVQAIVIALKTRTQETTSAVEDTMKALLWMGEQGVEHFYLKYCSTFDSTREGNIGPIADRAMELTGSKLSPFMPVASGKRQNSERWLSVCKRRSPSGKPYEKSSPDSYVGLQNSGADEGPEYLSL